MIEEPLGFRAKAPVSAWNQRLGVDYPGVFKALLKAALAAATANAPGAISAAIDGFFAFRVEDAKRPPEELAWLLIRRALAHAMAKLAVEALKRHDRDPDDPDGLVTRLDAALDRTEILIDHEFVERPAEHPIVATCIGPFQEWLRAYGLNEAETQSVTRRLGAYFTHALHREWAAHADDYRLLEAKLLEAETPFAKANALERAWFKNTAYLQRLIREPVFDEPFGLHDVYVPLRAYYVEELGEEAEFHQVRIEPKQPQQRRVAVDLRGECLRWLKVDDPRDAVRLISGDPGSGKTSFAKELAAELAENWPDEEAGAPRRVLFVPLHRFNFTGDLQLTLRSYLSAAGVLPPEFDSLDATLGVPRLLIFFDGLDEISEQGRPGREAIQKFGGQVDVLARTLNHTQPRVFFVLGGRQLSVDINRQHFQRRRQILHALPYHLSDAQTYHVDPITGTRNLRADLRQVWWQRYSVAKGKPYDGLPKPIDRQDLEPVTSQPLLNYLLAQSLERGHLDFSAPVSLNQIYGDLLAAVYERHWGDPEQAPRSRDSDRREPRPGHPALRPLAWEDFVRLLEEVALLAWHGTGRTVPANAVEKACEDLRLKDKLEAFKQGAEAGAVSLLISFFFRQAARIGGEPTFEFTHKSFGEYLTARRLVRAIAMTHDQRERNRRDPEDGWTLSRALEQWARTTGWAAIDSDLLAFLLRQIALQAPQAIERWHDTMAELFSEQLNKGLPMHKLALPSFHEMARQARNAEEALLVAVYCCASVADKPSEIQWPGPLALRDLLTRLAQGIPPLAHRCLSWLASWDGYHELSRADLEEANLNSAELSQAELDWANLEGANLEGVNLQGAYLKGASLRGANLKGANLENAHLEHVDLTGADLERANLQFAVLKNARLIANLRAAFLRGADLRYTYCHEATFVYADLSETKLCGANLEYVDLGSATLAGADLAGVRRLDRARRFEEVASWRGAKIERKWVERLGLDADRLELVVVDDLDEEGPPALD